MSIQSVSDFVYSIKEKLTDQEYMDVMNMLTELNLKKEGEKEYKFVLLFPTILTDNDIEENETKSDFTMTRHRIVNNKIEFISKLTKCNKQKRNSKRNMCHYCSCHPDANKCLYVDNMKENIKNECVSISLSNLLSICDENVYHLLKHTEINNLRNGMVESIYVEEYNEEEEGEEENISHYRKAFNKKIKYDSMNFQAEITLVSIKELN